MAEEGKNEQQDDSTDTVEKATEENPPVDKEQTSHNAAVNEAEADTTTPDGTSIDPEDQTFWEDSVDAKSVDISNGQADNQEIIEEKSTEQVETEAEGEAAAPDIPPADAPPAGEEAREPEEEQQESPTTQADEADSTSPTADSSEGEEQETADAESDEPQPKGKVLSFYRRLNKKTLIAGSSILLLIAGSIGFTVLPGLRSSGTGTPTFLGGIPETAYDMKFFLPLDVGYEKSKFVKVTIALELLDEGLRNEIEKNSAQLRKEVIDLILTKSPKEVKSSSGKKELSREITSRINNYLSKDCIKGTYFTELVIL